MNLQMSVIRRDIYELTGAILKGVDIGRRKKIK
jgi:hypothetical protein